MEATESTTRSAGPKLCKENRYYYRHREEILARQKQKKMEDPEFAARCQAREQSKAEREQKAAEREEKRKQEEELRRQKEEKRQLQEEQLKQKEEQKQEKDRLKREKAEEKAKVIEQKRLQKATLLGVI